ncbi:MAG: type I secretion system permease/ATPase [Sedimenticola sp.]
MKTAPHNSDENLGSILRSQGRGFAQIGLFSLFINLIMLVPPLYMLQVYDRVLTSRSEETLLLLTLILGWMFLTLGLLEFVRSRIMVRLAAQLDERLSQRLYRTVMNLALLQRGETGSQPLADLASIRQFMSGNGAFAFFDTPWIPVFIAILFLFDPLFGLLALFSAGMLFLLAIINEFSTRRLQKQAAAVQAGATATIDAQLRNAEVLRAMGMLPNLQQQWLEQHTDAIKAQSGAADRSGIWVNMSKTLRLLFQSLMLGLGAYLAINGQITAGMVIAGSIILGRALAPIDQMIGAWKGFISARTAYRRLDQLMSDIPEAKTRLSLPRPKGAIGVDRAILVPPGSETPALRGVSFAIRPGEALAVIGGSAAGKSSLVRAMLGVWPLASGSVRIDGAEIDQWNPEELGPSIGYLPQDVELFDGSVAENIARFGELDERKIIRAARVAGVDAMIRELPEGYDTRIGNQGASLSGGQRQRIALARAIYGKPSIIVLDEPNSNLDREGEKALSAACRYLKKKGTTLVVVTHRQRILKHMDKILVIEGGMQQLFGPRDAVLDQIQARRAPLHPVPNPRRHLHVAG